MATVGDWLVGVGVEIGVGVEVAVGVEVCCVISDDLLVSVK